MLLPPHVTIAQTVLGHTPPKMVALGTSCSAVAGPGRVVVQVFVRKDASFTVGRVISSSNEGDNAAALEVAASSTYQPGTLDGKADDEYFDGAIDFTAASPGQGFVPEVCAASDLVVAGKYAEAKARLAAYLQIHPDDPRANLVLGIADQLNKDALGAAAAFDKAGTIDPKYANVAAQAYIERGVAAVSAERYADGIADLQKARGLAAAGESSPANVAKIDELLGESYLRSGMALSSSGKPAEAVARLEAGAAAVPGKAAAFYGRAAYIMARVKSPDWKKVKAEADKALVADPNDGLANYVAGSALANDGKPREAVAFLNKAKISALYKDDNGFASQVDGALRSLNSVRM